MIEFLIVLAAVASIVGVSATIQAIVKKPLLPQHTDKEAIQSDWEVVGNDMDTTILEHAVETATDFLTINEVLADYEKHNKR